MFYNEAVRLQPSFARGYHNLGYAYQHLGRLEDALANYEVALTHVTDPTERMEARHSRSICLIGAGQLEEGFREYEIRNNERFRAYVHHMIKAPRWNGEPIEGLKLLLVGEQGLGDEFMFANILPDMMRELGPDGKLQVAVDPRLVKLFQRSFPQAEVAAMKTAPWSTRTATRRCALFLLPKSAMCRTCGRRWPRHWPSTASRWPIFPTSLFWCPMPPAWRNSARAWSACRARKWASAGAP